jgi:phospholipase D1/2
LQRNKAPNEEAIPLLMPHHHMVIPHYMGPSKEINGEAESKQIHGTDAKVNRLNSLPTPASCQDIPLLLPHEPDHQALPNGDINNGLSDHSNKTSWNQQSPSNLKVKQDCSLQDLQMKGFVDNLGSPEVSSVVCYANSKSNLLHMDKEWWETQERGDQVASVLDVGEVGPQAACRCQVCLFCCTNYSGIIVA